MRAECNMAVGGTAMGPLLVLGRRKIPEVLFEHCNTTGYQVDKSFISADVSPFVGAGEVVPQDQLW